MSPKSLTQRFQTWINEMDLQSQQKVLKYHRALIVLVALMSFVVGYYFKMFSICVYSTLVALAVSVVTMVPAWPCWKSNSLKFQPSQAPASSKEQQSRLLGDKSSPSLRKS